MEEKISLEQVRHVAKLANLELDEAEVAKFQKQLSAILEHVDILKDAQTDEVLPIGQITGLINVFREDRAQPNLSQDEALENAKQKEGGSFKVKAIFNDES